MSGFIDNCNQSFMYLGNVIGPLMGSAISAVGGFRWVFAATAVVVLVNSVQLIWVYRQSRRTAVLRRDGKV